VVRSDAHGLVLRLSDGGTISFAAKQLNRKHTKGSRQAARSPRALHLAGGVTLDIQGLTPGTTVLITESVSVAGQTTITIMLPTQPPPVTTGGQGSSTDGDAVGTITQVSATGLTISAGGQSMTFTADPTAGLTDGYAVGDVVDVTYATENGSLVAGDVEYVEQDVSGTVTALSAGSITIAADTGQTQTIVADPAEGMFDGVNVNDGVVITYHQSAGQLIADVVDDGTAGN
jgi:hypothetical protein